MNVTEDLRRRHQLRVELESFAPKFFSLVKKTSSCWFWQRTITTEGYGIFFTNCQRMIAHQYSYKLHVGEIHKGFTIDHICNVRHCVNPDHLRILTMRENILRSRSCGANHFKQNKCKRGHNLNGGSGVVFEGHQRVCIECRKIRGKALYRKKKAINQPQKDKS